MNQRRIFLGLTSIMFALSACHRSSGGGNVAANTKHLQAIHAGLLKYLKTHGGVWPQKPQNLAAGEELKWWTQTLQPYGVTAEDWSDPSNEVATKSGEMSYVLSDFDAEPQTAFRWDTQPWVITLAPASRGLAVLPDGRVMTLAERSKISPTQKMSDVRK